jgi:hypothetical protein
LRDGIRDAVRHHTGFSRHGWLVGTTRVSRLKGFSAPSSGLSPIPRVILAPSRFGSLKSDDSDGRFSHRRSVDGASDSPTELAPDILQGP